MDPFLSFIRSYLEQHKSSRTPLYQRLVQAIELFIQKSPAIDALEPIASEREMSQYLGISRITVRNSINILVKKNILYKIHGSGTYIQTQHIKPIRQSLQRLSGFTEDFSKAGVNIKQKWLKKEVDNITTDEALSFNLPASSKVLRLKRLRFIEDTPLAIEAACVPCKFLSSPNMVKDSLYAALSSHGYLPTHALQKFKAVEAQIEDAKLLQVPPGKAIMYIQRHSFLENNEAVELVQSLYRTDQYEFIAELKTMGR